MASLPMPEMPAKRPRDDETERLIREALEDEAARKREKKGLPPPGAAGVGAVAGVGGKPGKPNKGKTLAEIEDEEGGPVKESLVGMAHVKRAQRRRQGPAAAVDETDLVDDIADAEEPGSDDDDDDDGNDDGNGGGQRSKAAAGRQNAAAAKQQQQQHGGGGGAAAPLPGGDAAPLTAFNLKEERGEGHFDADGNFVFDRPDPAERDDEWLRSDEGRAVVSDEVRARVAAQQAAMAAADAAPAMGEAQIARAQLEMSRLMRPEETVAAALKRLRPADGGAKKAMGKREKARLARLEAERAAKAAKSGAGAGSDGGDAAAFARLTDLADGLVSAGELDVYAATGSQLARWAALTLPRSEIEGGGGGGGAGGGAQAAGGDNDEDDMFASDDDDAKPKPKPAATAAAATAQASAPPPAAAAPPAPTPEPAAAPAPPAAPAAPAPAAPAPANDDFDAWPVKELRRFLAERGVDASSYVEKADLVAAVRAAAQRGPARTGGGGAS